MFVWKHQNFNFHGFKDLQFKPVKPNLDDWVRLGSLVHTPRHCSFALRSLVKRDSLTCDFACRSMKNSVEKNSILDRLSPYICQQSPRRMLEDLVLQETLKKNMFRKGMVLISVMHLWQESKPRECFWILSLNMWIPDAFVLVCAGDVYSLLFLEASEAAPVNLIAEESQHVAFSVTRKKHITATIPEA